MEEIRVRMSRQTIIKKVSGTYEFSGFGCSEKITQSLIEQVNTNVITQMDFLMGEIELVDMET